MILFKYLKCKSTRPVILLETMTQIKENIIFYWLLKCISFVYMRLIALCGCVFFAKYANRINVYFSMTHLYSLQTYLSYFPGYKIVLLQDFNYRYSKIHRTWFSSLDVNRQIYRQSYYHICSIIVWSLDISSNTHLCIIIVHM